MKTLLALDSDLYQKRLVRELNSQEHGFYLLGERCLRARIRKGCFQVYRLCAASWGSIDSKYLLDATFTDAYGRTIVASRTP